MNSDEVWKDVRGYTGIYKVSNYGRVMSLRRKCVKENRIINGFVYNNRRYIHFVKNKKVKGYPLAHIVLLAFRDEYRNKRIAFHLDWNTMNDIETNLKWMKRGDYLRLLFHRKGVTNPNYKKPSEMGVYRFDVAQSKRKWRVCIKKDGKVLTMGYTRTKKYAKILYRESFYQLFGYFPY